MTGETFFGAPGQIARVEHSQAERFFVRPISFGVRAQPTRGWPVATLAAYALAQLESAGAFSGRDIQSVASETFGRALRLAQPQNSGHALANVAGERRVRPGVFVLHDPGTVLILENAILNTRLNASMATARSA